MKKGLTFVLLVMVISIFSEPLLWKIEGDNPSYIFGTIHYPDPRVTPLPETVTSKLDEVDVYVMEAVMDESAMGVIMQYVLLDSLTLEDILPEELYERCDSLLGTMGQSITMYNSMKPWMLNLTFSMPPQKEELPGEPMDLFLMGAAAERDMEIEGLETIEDQIKLFDEQSFEEQVKSLEKTLSEYTNYQKMLDEIIDIYANGDVEALHDNINFYNTEEDEREFIEKILYKRNETMFEGITARLNEGEKTYFFAVGAGHLGGEKGLLRMLEKEGLELKRVK